MKRISAVVASLLLLTALAPTAGAANAAEVPEVGDDVVNVDAQDVRYASTDLDLSATELAEFAESDEPKTIVEDPLTGEIIGVYEGLFSEAAAEILDYEIEISPETTEVPTEGDGGFEPFALSRTVGYCATGALCTISVSPYPFYGFTGSGRYLGNLLHQNGYSTGSRTGRAAIVDPSSGLMIVGPMRAAHSTIYFSSSNRTIGLVDRG